MCVIIILSMGSRCGCCKLCYRSFDLEDTKVYKDRRLELSLEKLRDTIYRRYGDKQPLCYLHSYGCQQNVSDGEKIMEMLRRAGYGFTDSTENADLVILNTCAVRENAEDRVFGVVGSLKKLKERRPDTIIGICGCMAQQETVCQKIKESYKQVDLVFGTYAYGDLFELLDRLLTEKVRLFHLGGDTDAINEELVQLRSNKIKATVPIMYGCNNFCTYCIVPYVRGRERSRKPEAVIGEVRGLVEQGCREITLLGQNVNSYAYGFADLLKEIDRIDGHFRVRFMSSHPKDASRELIDTIVQSRHICKQLHLPVQCGSNRILKLMNRRYTVEDYLKIIDYAREKSPDFCFSTDIIVGFPGETYEEFRQSADLLAKVGFYNVFSFVFSKRTGTKAAEMKDDISDKEKGLWLRELLLEQRETSQKINDRFVGKIKEVLVDGVSSSDKQLLSGRTDEGLIVEFAGDTSLIGEFVDVRITKAMNWALAGEIFG